MLVIGSISKAQGVRGEVKVSPLTDDINRFKKLKNVFISGKSYNVTGAKVLCNGVFLKLEGVDDRNKAELLVGKKLEIERKDAVDLHKGEYFIVDLIGAEVTVDGDNIGKLVDILQHGAADVFVVEKDKKQVLFPFLKAAINNIDVDKKIIDLKRDKFEEIAVYED